MDRYDLIKSSLELLNKYSWIHNEKVIFFFKNKLAEHFFEEWKDTISSLSSDELSAIPYGLIKEHWPRSFKDFLKECFSLSSMKYNVEKFSQYNEITKQMTTGMNAKKVHEVGMMSKLIHTYCDQFTCKRIIDIGSGLGYLDFVMTSQSDYEILGLEVNVEMAHKTNVKAESKPNANFKTIQFSLNENTINKLKETISSVWNVNGDTMTNDRNVCLVGLHCCGDLSASVIKTFCEVQDIRLMILFSCCYHSMKQNGDGTFQNFPLSTKLKNHKNYRCLNVQSFRLAAQQTRSTWGCQTTDERKSHMLNVAYRSTLELALAQNNLDFKKSRRKLAKVDDNTSFEDYLHNVACRSNLKIEDEVVNKMVDLHKKNKHQMNLIEPYTMFQVMFQPIIEHLILMDRCAYIQERGFSCKLVQVFDDQVSPRNCAIIAYK